MKELSIFVDESGDFGEYNKQSPYYIISLVMHDQSVDISEELTRLESQMEYLGWPKHCIHAGPIIRSEHEYKEYDLESRQKILKRLMSFTRKIDIRIKSVHIEKRNISDSIEAAGKLSKQLSHFIRNEMQLILFDGAKNWLQNKGIRPNISELEQVNNDVKALEKKEAELEKKCRECKKSVHDLDQKYRNITQYLGIDKKQDTIKK